MKLFFFWNYSDLVYKECILLIVIIFIEGSLFVVMKNIYFVNVLFVYFLSS